MKLFSQILSFSLPVLYLCVIYLYYMIYQGKSKRFTKKTTVFLVLLLVLHGLEIITRNISIHTMPLSSIHDSYSFLAFSILFVYMFLEMGLENKGSGLFILSLAGIFEVLSAFTLNWEAETNELLSNPSFAIHASLSIMGYTALSISAIYALIYLIQNNNLKKRNLGKLFVQLPAITYLESMGIRSVIIGIVLLGAGILLGHFQALKMIGDFWPNDIKVIISDAVWIIYLGGFIISKLLKWRGKRMAYVSLIGYIILIIGGGIIIFMSETFHKFN